jgi:hypothetical protein
VADSSLQLALERGWNYQASRFDVEKAYAIMHGALGRTATVGAAVRPLVEDARQRLEASKHWLSKAVYRRENAEAARLEAGLAAGAHVDALAAVLFEAMLPPEPTVDDIERRTCSYCGDRQTELKRCGACKAHGGAVFYCGADCQKRHWTAHRAECRRLQAASAASTTAAGQPTAAAASDPTPVGVDAMTVKELKALLYARGVSVLGMTDKQELVAAVKAAL